MVVDTTVELRFLLRIYTVLKINAFSDTMNENIALFAQVRRYYLNIFFFLAFKLEKGNVSG